MDNEFRTINVKRVNARLKQAGYTEEFEYDHSRSIGKAYKVVKDQATGKQSYVGMKVDADRYECVTIDARDSETGKWISCAEAFKALGPLVRTASPKAEDDSDK